MPQHRTNRDTEPVPSSYRLGLPRLRDQAGRSDRAGAEPRAGRVDGAVGLAPADRTLVERELAGRPVGVDQALQPDPDEAQPRALQAERVVQALAVA